MIPKIVVLSEAEVEYLENCLDAYPVPPLGVDLEALRAKLGIQCE